MCEIGHTLAPSNGSPIPPSYALSALNYKELPASQQLSMILKHLTSKTESFESRIAGIVALAPFDVVSGMLECHVLSRSMINLVNQNDAPRAMSWT